jgi:hypothetical protein
MDARAYTSAMANAYVGGGRENPGNDVTVLISSTDLIDDANTSPLLFYYRPLPERFNIIHVSWEYPRHCIFTSSCPKSSIHTYRINQLAHAN